MAGRQAWSTWKELRVSYQLTYELPPLLTYELRKPHSFILPALPTRHGLSWHATRSQWHILRAGPVSLARIEAASLP